jgi:hypothetical protein
MLNRKQRKLVLKWCIMKTTEHKDY